MILPAEAHPLPFGLCPAYASSTFDRPSPAAGRLHQDRAEPPTNPRRPC
jgi:hypothetical protein